MEGLTDDPPAAFKPPWKIIALVAAVLLLCCCCGGVFALYGMRSSVSVPLPPPPDVKTVQPQKTPEAF